MERKLSAASRRAAAYRQRGPEWWCQFSYSPAHGLGLEEGVHRRDPSSIIKVGDLYYVYYTKSIGPVVGHSSGDPDARVTAWDQADIWYATSEDGVHWRERGPAVTRGPRGAYDDRSVFTPDVLAHGGKYYLVCQVVQHPYLQRSFESIAMAVAHSPDGPWQKLPRPILEPTRDGEWLGDEDDRFHVKSRGSWDSHRVHDPMLVSYRGQFWLYYKGVQMGMLLTYAGFGTKWGLAVADRPEGPYVKSPYNPVTNSGHETLLWPYNGGMAALLTTDGPEKNTIQYARDGLNFEIMSMPGRSEGLPHAGGAYRTPDHDASPLEGIHWGLCHVVRAWNHLQRFDATERAKLLHRPTGSPA